MSAPKQYKVYSISTGDLLAEGTARQCAEKLRFPSDTIRAIARGAYTSHVYLVEEQKQQRQERNVDPNMVAAAKRWDAFCEPIRKRFGIEVKREVDTKSQNK